MNADVVIVGAGPAGIFTALEMIKKGSRQKIVMVEKGQPVEKRHCPKDKTKKCVNCKPYCHITTGFSGAGAFSGRTWPRSPSTTPTRSTWSSARMSTSRAWATRRSGRRSAAGPSRRG